MGTSLVPVEIEMTDRDQDKLKKALHDGRSEVSLRAQLRPGSKKILLVTERQLRHQLTNGKAFTMRRRQLLKNKSFEAGFIVSLLTSLAIGLTSALVESAISGSGADGKGLILNKRRRKSSGGDGLFLNKRKRNSIDGDGLFLNKRTGPNLYLRKYGKLVKVHQKGESITLRPIPDDITTYTGDGLFLIDGKNVFTPTECLENVLTILV